MAMHIDLNSDLGESYGPWKMGDDPTMLGIITSANVACGWHGGDPMVMHETAVLAKKNGVAIGAHPSFNDRDGFGRRVIRGDSMADIEKMVAYQIGALQAIATMAGHKVTHVKPHGSLGNLAAAEDDFAMAVGRAIKAVDPRLVYVVMPGLASHRAAEKLGLPLVREIFADRAIEDNGDLVSRKKPGAMIHDPDVAADRMVRAVQERMIMSAGGKQVAVEPESICVHSDTPAAIAIARRVREKLTAAGIVLKPFVGI